MLIKHEANVNRANNDGFAAIHCAVENGKFRI